MPNYVPSIVVDTIIEALGSFLTPFVSGCPVVRGQQNRVPPPVDSFVLLTELLQVPLETSSVVTEPTQVTITGPTRIDIQVDFYGPSAADQCRAVATVYRTPYAPPQFPTGIAPLYCSDGQQTAAVMGEQQYEDRWTLTASLQYNPAITLPQQSANTLAMNILEDLQ